MSNAIRIELINLAAEMAQRKNMPDFSDDSAWCKSTPIRERRRVLNIARRADDQATSWAIRLKDIIDRLPAQTSGEQS